ELGHTPCSFPSPYRSHSGSGQEQMRSSLKVESAEGSDGSRCPLKTETGVQRSSNLFKRPNAGDALRTGEELSVWLPSYTPDNHRQTDLASFSPRPLPYPNKEWRK